MSDKRCSNCNEVYSPSDQEATDLYCPECVEEWEEVVGEPMDSVPDPDDFSP